MEGSGACAKTLQISIKMDINVLPAVNASLNGFSACILTVGYLFIRRKMITAHKTCMCLAICASVLFLVSYLYYHAHHGVTRFEHQGLIRTIYFTILITHTVLAAVIIPLVVKTVSRALKGDIERHKSIARVTLPLWLYVSVTGVVIYGMLYWI